jgi:hypothetical protein
MPDVDILVVTIDSEDFVSEVSCDSEDYPWVYEEIDLNGTAQPTIRFQRDKLPPVAAKISVEYNIFYGEGQEFTCGGE